MPRIILHPSDRVHESLVTTNRPQIFDSVEDFAQWFIRWIEYDHQGKVFFEGGHFWNELQTATVSTLAAQLTDKRNFVVEFKDDDNPDDEEVIWTATTI